MATTIDRRPSQLLGRSALANLSVAALYEKAIERSEGMLAAAGPLVVRTGKHTGRSPKDKYIVDEPDSHDGVWWGGFNQPISEEATRRSEQRFIDHIEQPRGLRPGRFVGADPTLPPLRARVYTETAWASIFCDNLFIRPHRGRAGRLRAQLHDHRCAQLQGRPGARRHAQRDGHPGSPGHARRSSSAAPSTPAR